MKKLCYLCLVLIAVIGLSAKTTITANSGAIDMHDNGKIEVKFTKNVSMSASDFGTSTSNTLTANLDENADLEDIKIAGDAKTTLRINDKSGNSYTLKVGGYDVSYSGPEIICTDSGKGGWVSLNKAGGDAQEIRLTAGKVVVLRGDIITITATTSPKITGKLAMNNEITTINGKATTINAVLNKEATIKLAGNAQVTTKSNESLQNANITANNIVVYPYASDAAKAVVGKDFVYASATGKVKFTASVNNEQSENLPKKQSWNGDLGTMNFNLKQSENKVIEQIFDLKEIRRLTLTDRADTSADPYIDMDVPAGTGKIYFNIDREEGKLNY